MGSTELTTHLTQLRQAIERATVRGSFLLSTGDVSNHWIAIEELRAVAVTDTVVKVIGACMKQLHSIGGVQSIAVPELGWTTEDQHFWNPILFGLHVTRPAMHDGTLFQFHKVRIDRRERPDVSAGAPPGSWLVLFTMSSYADVIVATAEELRRTGRHVDHAMVLIERDDDGSRELLRDSGIELVPMVVFDNKTGSTSCVVDIHRDPYPSYYRIFA